MRAASGGRAAALIYLFLALSTDTLFAGSGEPSRELAVASYEAGRYEEARELLEQLDAAGQADGPLLYRLYFAQSQSPDGAGPARETQARAREALEGALADTDDLEVPFYLASIYGSIGKLSDRVTVAQQATARIETGSLEVPETGVAYFRVGKLYADQQMEDKAAEWYGRALTALDPETPAEAAYIRFASRQLAESAFEAGDYVTAAKAYEVLSGAEPSGADLDRLATARARSGDYAGAADAWRKAVLLNPVEANRPRYCAQIAAQSESFGALPATSPDGRAWAELAKAELEALMLSEVQAAQAVMEQARGNTELTEAQRASMTEDIEGHREIFLAGALEYALRGLPVRETAFQGGYAPLIFHQSRWRLPW